MANWVEKALTRTVIYKQRGKERKIEVPPSQKLVYTVYFSLGMVACLTALEAVHLIILERWNPEIFTVISGLVGSITGIFLSQKT